MIKTISIKNFKSVVDLSLELGGFNVLIGENGCGKSNILEAIAFGAASNADKLNHEFLGSRGIRTTQSEFMFSAFENGKNEKSIEINFTDTNNKIYPVNLKIESEGTQKWVNTNKAIALKEIDKWVLDNIDKNGYISDSKPDSYSGFDWLATIKSILKESGNEGLLNFSLFSAIIDQLFKNEQIGEFIIYNPEQSSLREFRESKQIFPLGIGGEGLFQELKKITNGKKENPQIEEIKELLFLIDWFEDFKMPANLISNEFTLQIKDRYLDQNLQFFDQRSTNEGFLFLLFYFTLFISTDTPPFFAIDNIEASFNPKLCTKVVQTLAKLTKEKKKQVIITTHNPAALDGIDLQDDDNRLFVVGRNMEGHTKVRRIEYKANRSIPLSEAWRKGLIGGLPDNF
ncbi:MAG: AAA family ATPase [Mariniphaga sp.]